MPYPVANPCRSPRRKPRVNKVGRSAAVSETCRSRAVREGCRGSSPRAAVFRPVATDPEDATQPRPGRESSRNGKRPPPRGSLATALLLACLTGALSLPTHAQEPGEVLWTFDTLDVVQSSPALAPDGTIYVGSHDGSLYAVNPDGAQKWRFRTAASVASSPVVAADGTIYVGSLDRTLYALTPAGRIKWLLSPRSSIAATPALGHDGDLYVATAFNRLYAISPRGAKSWEYNAGGNLVSSPLVTPDGSICFGCQDRRLYALSPDGSKNWTFTAGDKINSSPALGADGRIFFGSFDGKLYAINPDGTQSWEYATGNAIRSSPAIGLNGLVLVGSDDGKLHAVSPEGNLRWTHLTGGQVRSSPAVGKDGVIYVGSYDDTFHAIGPNGGQKWSLKAGAPITASPVIDANGVVYFGSWDKKLYAVKCSSLGLADSSWPMFRGDAQHAGNLSAERPAAATLQLTHLDSQIELREPAIVRLFASGSDKADPVQRVDFFRGSERLGRVEEAPFVWIQEDTAAGSHTFRAKAEFASGRTAQSPAIVVTVHPSQPTPRPTKAPSPTMATRPKTRTSEPKKPEPKPAAPPTAKPTTAAKPPPPSSPRPAPEPGSSLAGSFSGLIHPTAVLAHDSTGFISVAVGKDGSYRGELHYAGRAHGIRGSFDEKGSAAAQISRRRQKPINLRMWIDADKDPDVLHGVVSNGRATSEILADRHVHDGRTSKAPEAGRYTLAFAGAADNAAEFFGNGFGTLVVSAEGEARFEGQLGDGTKIAQQAHLSKKGVWSFYAPAHQDQGCVVGWIRFKEQEFGDLFGQLTWIHPAVEDDERLARGFTAELSVIGSRFSPAAAKDASLLRSGYIALAGDGFRDKTFVNSFARDGDRLKFAQTTPLKCRVSFDASTGLISGSFVHPLTGRASAIRGVILQKQNSALGFFLGPNRAGPVNIAPAGAPAE